MKNKPQLKTYTQSKKRKPFDWNEFLDKALKGKITKAQAKNAIKLASNWVTCACGNQCEIIPRNADSSPEDNELHGLGIDFAIYIEDEQWDYAKNILEQIEIRSEQVIQEEIKRSTQTLKKFGYKITKE